MDRQIVKVFRALADPNRLRIVKMLEQRELCVCEVREVLALSNSTVSKHLSILHDAGLVTQTKEARWVNYSLNVKSESQFVRAIISALKSSLLDDETVLKDTKSVDRVDRNKICRV